MALTLSVPKLRKVTLGVPSSPATGKVPRTEALPPEPIKVQPERPPQEPAERPQTIVTQTDRQEPSFNELEAFLRQITPDYDPDGEPLHKAYFRRQQRQADLLAQIQNGRIQAGVNYTRAQLLKILRTTPGKHSAWAIEGLRVLSELGLLYVDPVNKIYRVTQEKE
jgi:hypothetical protein